MVKDFLLSFSKRWLLFSAIVFATEVDEVQNEDIRKLLQKCTYHRLFADRIEAVDINAKTNDCRFICIVKAQHSNNKQNKYAYLSDTT